MKLEDIENFHILEDRMKRQEREIEAIEKFLKDLPSWRGEISYGGTYMGMTDKECPKGREIYIRFTNELLAIKKEQLEETKKRFFFWGMPF